LVALMIDMASVAAWVKGYERAWRQPGTDALAGLFSPAATYRGSPFAPVHRGLDAIAELWERERDGPDERFDLQFDVVAVTDPRAVVRLEVRYDPPDGQHYRDLWILAFDDDGRCVSFEEWPFWPEGTDGAISGSTG
jgi:hypothetical protein